MVLFISNRNLRIPYSGANPQKCLINSNKQDKQKVEENLNIGLLLFSEVCTIEVHHKNYPLAPAGISGYLYKEASLWYIHLFPDEYKTGKNYLSKFQTFSIHLDTTSIKILKNSYLSTLNKIRRE